MLKNFEWHHVVEKIWMKNIENIRNDAFLLLIKPLNSFGCWFNNIKKNIL
jgi:hypothetical protein